MTVKMKPVRVNVDEDTHKRLMDACPYHGYLSFRLRKAINDIIAEGEQRTKTVESILKEMADYESGRTKGTKDSPDSPDRRESGEA